VGRSSAAVLNHHLSTHAGLVPIITRVYSPTVPPYGSNQAKDRLNTVGSYWPYATTLFDYIHRAMPADKPQSLAPDEVYALCAYLLYLNGIVPEDAVMDARSLPQVVMPNHAGFTSPDPRPDVFTTVAEAAAPVATPTS
jgi:hypothetical protein